MEAGPAGAFEHWLAKKKQQQAMPKKKKGKNDDDYDLPDLPEVRVLHSWLAFSLPNCEGDLLNERRARGGMSAGRCRSGVGIDTGR